MIPRACLRSWFLGLGWRRWGGGLGVMMGEGGLEGGVDLVDMRRMRCGIWIFVD